MATPATYNLSIYQGDTFQLTFRLRSQNPDGTLGSYIDLTGMSVESQIRATAEDVTYLVQFDATVLDQTVTPGGVQLVLTSDVTAALAETGAQSYVWDVQVYSSDTPPIVTTYLRGSVTVESDVTR